MATAQTLPRIKLSSSSALSLGRIADFTATCVLVVSLITFVAQAYQNWTYLEDDCLIFFRYALNFHAGHGWVMNPGERVNGCTSPFALWLVTGLTTALSIDWAIFALKLLGMTCGVLVLFTARALTLAVLPGQKFIASLVMLLIAYRLDFTLSMINGLETPYACAALLTAVLWFWKAEEKHSVKAEIAAVILFVVAGLARPEMAVLYPALCAARFIIYCRGNWLLLAYLVPFAALATFNYFYYGDVLPNTFYAKQASLAEGLAQGGGYLSKYLGLRLQLFGGWVLLLCIAALVARSRRQAWILITTGSVYAATILRTHGDWMADGRFAVPILPLLVLAWVAGFYVLLDSLRPAWQYVPKTASILILLTLSNVVWRGYDELARSVSAYVAARNAPMPFTLPNSDLSSWSCGSDNGRRLIGEWIQKHVQPGQAVLYSEMGITTAMNRDVRFIDATGLCDATVAKMKGYTRNSGGLLCQQDWYKPDTEFGRYVAQRKPDFVILADEIIPGSPFKHLTDYQYVDTVTCWYELVVPHPHSIYKRRL